MTFLQRYRAVWGSAHAQDIAEYAVMLAIILLLVIGTVKLIGRNQNIRDGATHPSSRPSK